jgi:uncharacterized protein (UPF0276 family)
VDARFPTFGAGVGLKPAHAAAIAARPGRVAWVEAISENYLGPLQRSLPSLERVRRDHPVALHGVAMSLGCADGVDPEYLRLLAALVRRVEPFLVSDHLCFTSAGGHHSHDLLPMPFTPEALAITVANIQTVQETLGRPILVENVASYVTAAADEMSEAAFVAEAVKRAGCGLLLDVNNVFVNAHNHGFDARAYIDALPCDRVGEIHVAGHSQRDDFLFDDHAGPTPEAVWSLFEYALARTGPVNTLVEWDSGVPAFAVLAAEADRARAALARAAA